MHFDLSFFKLYNSFVNLSIFSFVDDHQLIPQAPFRLSSFFFSTFGSGLIFFSSPVITARTTPVETRSVTRMTVTTASAAMAPCPVLRWPAQKYLKVMKRNTPNQAINLEGNHKAR